MSAAIQAEFQRRYQDWLDHVESHPEIRLSSRRADYIDNAPYRRLIALGRPALAYVMDMLELGEFRLMPAALEIARLRVDDVVPDPGDFYSDQQIALALLEWWRPRRRIPWFLLPIVNIFLR